MTIRFVEPEEYDCAREGCDETRTEHTSVAGSYCSEACANRAAGAALLRDLRNDHRFCGTCFRLRKDVEQPSDEYARQAGWTALIREAVVGHEHLTEHVTTGPHGVECRCSAVDHTVDADWLRDEHPYHWYLKLAVAYLREHGKRDDRLDIVTLVDELWADTDLELAVGRALEDAR